MMNAREIWNTSLLQGLICIYYQLYQEAVDENVPFLHDHVRRILYQAYEIAMLLLHIVKFKLSIHNVL